MRYPAPGSGHLPDFIVIDTDGVGEPNILSKPAKKLHPFDRTEAENASRVNRSSSNVSQRWVCNRDFVSSRQDRQIL